MGVVGEFFPGEHVVQIHEDNALFLDTLAEFASAGLVRGEAVVVIATPQHRYGLWKRLGKMDLDLVAAHSMDQLIVLDAEETMAKFMVEEWPNDVLFSEVSGGILNRATRNGRTVRVFGEMVAVMWRQGWGGAALKLEHLWADTSQKRDFSLFCAYPRTVFTKDIAENIGRVCALHSRVLEA
jgi:hypothetical protein